MSLAGGDCLVSWVSDATEEQPRGRRRNRHGSRRAGRRIGQALRQRDGEIDAVRGVDLRVEAGEVFGFLGPNGAGKSTAVQMLTTLLSITSGSAQVAGVDVAASPTRCGAASASRSRRRGSTRARPDASCSSCRRGCSGSHRGAASERDERTARAGGARGRGRPLIKGYSGGMKRRLDLASALVHEPEVLFLDEPTTGLDPASRLTVWDEVRRINKRGTTVFLTTQYLEEADQLCDRLAIIDDGRIVREGTPAEAQGGPARAAGLDERAHARRRVPGRHRPHPRPGGGRRAGGVGMNAGLGSRTARAARGLAHARGAAPHVFIPLFFLVVNVGQAAEDLPVRRPRSSCTVRATGPSSCPARCCSRRRSAPRRCSSSRTSRAATSTSCARRRCRGPRSCWAG